MKIPGAQILEDTTQCEEPCVLAIGIFDGLHKGHAKVLNEAKSFAKELGAKAFVLTFTPHPSRVVRGPSLRSMLIYPPAIRTRMLLNFGMDAVYFKKFDKKFASLTPPEFVTFLLAKFPYLRGIVIGENFRFGKGAKTDYAWLKTHEGASKIQVKAVPGVMEDGEYISSTRLRHALSGGRMGEFEKMAGRPYFCMGKVSSGKHLGRVIGFPTLNLHWNQECMPPFGAYASRLHHLSSGGVYEGVSSLGTNPTVEKTKPVLETNLFQDVNIGRGAEILVELLWFFRPEAKFDSVEALKTQIAQDKLNAVKFFQEA